MATEPMTSPRKPVAWAQIEDGEIVAIGFRKCKATGCITPIGPTVDLQPLWALVEKFEKGAILHANTCMSDGTAGTYEACADELRETLEAMNGQ